MANGFVSPQILDAIINPGGGAALSRGIQSLGGGLSSLRQERQQAQAQQSKVSEDQEALFLSNATRIEDPQRRAEFMQQGLQAGAIDQEDFNAISAIPFQQQNAAIFDTFRLSGRENLIPGIGKVSTAVLSPGQRLVESQTGREIATGLADTTTEAKNLADIRKETRGRLGTELKDISKQAGVVKQNYNKVQNLAKEVAKGNRISASQALVALVKLGDPGSVVSGNEVNTALNAPNPLAAMTEMLTSKGVSGDVITAVAQRIDPLNPKNINTKDLLATANALVSANIPTIQSRFSEARAQGIENLTEPGIKSLFSTGLENRVSALSELGVGQSAEQDANTNQQALDWANNNPGDPRAAQIKQRLGVQ